jgi:hypothetical protein
MQKRMQGQKMSSRTVAVIKWIWLGSAAGVLLVSLYFYDGKPNSDADVLLAYGMLALAFPISLLLSIVGGTIGQLGYSSFGYVPETSYWSIALTWLCFFAAGYWQWFKFAPWLIRKLRARRKAST